MATVRIRIGRPTEIVYPEYRTDAEALAEVLRSQGFTVADLEVSEYRGLRGGVPVEWLLIFIGSSLGAALISNITDDLYASARRWARKRHARKEMESETGESRPVGFVIYGPGGEELRRWSTRDE